MRKKSLVAMVVALALTASIMIGATLAYFVSETDPVTNTFTIGNVKIELDEPSWDDETSGKDILPGVTIPKDPTVYNTGVNEAYVAVTVKGMNGYVDADGNYTPGTVTDQNGIVIGTGMSDVGFVATVNAGWVKVNADGTVDTTWDAVNRPLVDGIYAYMEKLAAWDEDINGYKVDELDGTMIKNFPKTIELFSAVEYKGLSYADFFEIVSRGDGAGYVITVRENGALATADDVIFETEALARNYIDSVLASIYACVPSDFDLVIKAYAIQTEGEGFESTETNPYPWVEQLGIVFPVRQF